MYQKFGLHFILAVSILATITEARSRLKVVESPPDGVEVLNINNDKLWAEVKAGNIAGVKAAIRAGANPLSPKTVDDDMTVLQYASYYNNPGMVKVLLEVGGVDVNLQKTEGRTPAYYASVSGATEALNILIEHNADVNIPGYDGYTPLMSAVVRGHQSIANTLINANASLDVTGGLLNATALYYAVYGDNLDIVSLLIKHNADVNIPDYDGWTPLMIAAVQDHLSIAKTLINANASLDATGRWFNATALHYAALYNHQDIALLLLSSGADTMITDLQGRTPAALARYEEHNHLADLIETYTTLFKLGISVEI